MSYKTTPNAIHFPAVRTPDTGINRVPCLTGTRYKVWYLVGGRRRYVMLPKGIDITEARSRRNRLYKRLKDDYGAKRKVMRGRTVSEPAAKKPIKIAPGRFVYERHPYVVRIRGKQVATARTVAEAEIKRDQWLAANGLEVAP